MTHNSPLQHPRTRPGLATAEVHVAAADALEEYLAWARQQYRDIWGRDMADGDPLFPDWDAPVPVPSSPVQFEGQIVAALEEARVDPALIYAYQHSGILLTEENESCADPRDVAAWHAAIARFDALTG